jgi:hypothetical protein
MKRFSLPVAFVLFFGVLLAAPAQATGELAANGMTCTIVGTEGDDEIVGTGYGDVICGLGGDDEIDAGAGDDVVDGGTGDDFIQLGEGDDYSFGGPGADKLFGGDGRDALLGGNDNDSLIGGSGVDDLDGEAGVNYCDVGAGESTENCFFDQGGPKLVSMSVLNPTIDTSKSDQVFVLRARIDDVGTGVAGFNIQFDPHNFDGGRPLFFNGGNYSEEACGGPGATDPDPNNRTVRSSYCLISGDRFSGIYEIKVRVPRYTPKMTWKVQGFSGQDFAGNQSDYNTDDVKAKGLMLTVKQKGKGDSFKPTLGAVAVMTKTINTQSSAAIVNIRVAFKDKGVGVKNFQGSFVMGNDFEKTIDFNYEAYSSMNSCVNGVAPDPTMPGSGISCLMAGNELGGVIDYKVMIRKLSPKGTYKLNSMVVFDEGGNTTGYGNGGKKFAKNQKGLIKQIGKGDDSAPKITSIKVLTPKVSTGSGSAEVRIQVKAKDNLAGISQLGVNFSRKLGKSSSYINFSFSVTDQNCGPDGRAAFPTSGISGVGYSTGCLVSGTLNDGVFEIVTKLPANAAKAKYVVDGISAEDAAGNGGGTSTNKFNKVVITNG